MTWLVLLLLTALVPSAARAQAGATGATRGLPLPVTRAVRIDTTIQLDGRLDESAWRSAPVTPILTQIDPLEGQPASQRTEVRVLYDDEALYVGARLYDTGPITARLGRRDMRLGDSDWFGVMLDSYHDHRTAFGFDVNPAGVQRDEVKTIEHDDNSWNAVWRVATSVDSAGWTAEYRIPFSQLRFRPDSALTWGVQFERIIGRNHEYSASTFIPRSAPGGVPAYGHLVGLRDLEPGSSLELLPYVVSRAEYVDPGANPFRTTSEYSSSFGGDLRYRVASNLTLNASVNPDFGQVEVDPAVVNLGVYETFFDEKRPLFLEGSEIFDFASENTSGGRTFYSRRIGRRPSLGAPTDEADIPTATTILGAAKLTGKIGGWSVGSLAALTDREEARYRDSLGLDRHFVVEPRATYLVTRARRELNGGRSMIGGMVTGVHRALTSDSLQSELRSDAGMAGLDFRHQTQDRMWALDGDVAFTYVRGTPAAMLGVQRASNHFFQRPDAPQLSVDSAATSLSGYRSGLSLRRQGGEHWRGGVAAALTSPGYEVNDLGFGSRTDRADVEAELRYRENRPGAVLREWSAELNVRSEHNFAGEPIMTRADLDYDLTTLGYFDVRTNLTRQFRSFDDRLTRGGPMALRPAQWSGRVSLSTDGRRNVTGNMRLGGSSNEAGGWTWSLHTELGLKPSDRWSLSVGPTFSRDFIVAQYLASVDDASYAPTYGQRYLFAPLSRTELGIETRFNVAFTPTLSLETYVQPLISTGDFGAPKQLVAARGFDFVPWADTLASEDFNLRSLRGNSVLRWEWREGSTLFVAWQQSRRMEMPFGDFDLERDGRNLFAIRPDNIFVVKMSYWLTP
ncbi:MAG TPA: DUF5916 domain-containing protein [Gemmatimonadaceae bacterium]|nr:DUF5916 domain-containing protein [Gemmatimonadaceae bacterium]